MTELKEMGGRQRFGGDRFGLGEFSQRRTQRNPYDASVLSQMRAVLHVFKERGFVEQALWHLIPLGAARAYLGFAAEGVALLKQAVQQMAKSGRSITITQALNHLAGAQAIIGAVDDAFSTTNEALLVSSDERYVRPETYRLRGELWVQRGNWSEAESDFREAIAMARQSGAKSWELRASTSLARMLKNAGRISEASDILTGIYNWFGEGFDTVHLKEAKALLKALSA